MHAATQRNAALNGVLLYLVHRAGAHEAVIRDSDFLGGSTFWKTVVLCVDTRRSAKFYVSLYRW